MVDLTRNDNAARKPDADEIAVANSLVDLKHAGKKTDDPTQIKNSAQKSIKSYLSPMKNQPQKHEEHKFVSELNSFSDITDPSDSTSHTIKSPPYKGIVKTL